MRGLVLAWQEIRVQPARFAAILAAIAVSVAFLSATQVFGATESGALAKRQVLYASQADVIVDTHLWNSTSASEVRNGALTIVNATLARHPDVVAYEPFSQLYARVSHNGVDVGAMLNSTLKTQAMRWYQPSEGRLPSGLHEIMLTTETAEVLGVGLGDVVTLSGLGDQPITVVGLTDERGYADPPGYVPYDLLQRVDAQLPPLDPLVLVDPTIAERTTPGSSGGGVGIRVLVQAVDPSKAAAIASDVQQALTNEGFLKITAQPKIASQVREEAVEAVAAGQNWMPQLISGCAVVAMLVGALIIANTFTILLAQRRRQIGLLRAVGASRRQVAGRFFSEALLLGVVGSLIGVPVGIGAAALISWLGTHSLEFGLVVPWWRVVGVLLLGVLATVVSALLPIRRAASVLPMEALQPVSAATFNEVGRRRTRLCAALAVVGLGAMVGGFVFSVRLLPAGQLGVVAGGAALLTIGVLASSAAYVPRLLRFFGAPLLGLRPETRLAVLNSDRNPARAGATATALMLAVGMIITVQVGSAAGRGSAFTRLDERYPIDLSLQSALLEPELLDANAAGEKSARGEDGLLVGFSDDALATVRSNPGVTGAEPLQTTEPLNVIAGPRFSWLPVAAMTPAADRLLSRPVVIEPGHVGLSTEVMRALDLNEGESVRLRPLSGEQVEAEVVECNIGPHVACAGPDIIAALDMPTKDGLILARLTDPDTSATVTRQLSDALIERNPGLDVSGSAELKASVRAMLDGVTLIITGLLMIAVAVALVGVSNTLALSVHERTRESALLRALGTQRAGLRVMLLIEAVLLSAVGVSVGSLFGVAFGWTGAATLLRAMGLERPGLMIDWPLTMITCAAIIGAGGLASVLPGQRAAMATPVEAMADRG